MAQPHGGVALSKRPPSRSPKRRPQPAVVSPGNSCSGPTSSSSWRPSTNAASPTASQTPYSTSESDRFPDAPPDLRIEVLHIPDDYAFMDPELIHLLQERVEPLILELT